MDPLTHRDGTSSDAPIPAGTPQEGCRRVRRWVAASLCRRLGPEAAWIRRHTANCPRCQKRIAASTRVELALSIVKSQPHRPDLLKRANTHAIGMLKHSLREASEAQSLKDARSEPSFMERSAVYRYRLANIAACFAIVALTRTGLFSSLQRFSTRGQECMRQYYAVQVGEELAGELFDA